MTIVHSGMAIEDALTSENPLTRTMARCAVGGWVEGLSAWVNDEMNRPDGNPMITVQAMSIVMIQTIASVAAQVSAPEADELLRRAIGALVDGELVSHMQKIREVTR